MNHVSLMGRLTKDPEVKYTQTGKCVASFTIAVNRPIAKDKEQVADFVPCIAWGKTAEFIGNYFSKGRMIAVEGRNQTRSYEAKDGSKRFVMEVNVNTVHFTGEPKDESKKDSKGFEDFGSPVPFDEEIPF